MALSNSEILSVFSSLRIKHPRIETVTEVCNDLRSTVGDKEPKQFGTIFAPSHVGKSTALKTYIEKVAVPQAVERGLVLADLPLEEQVRRQKLVVHVTLEGGSTPRSLCADILGALGDPRSTRGTKNQLLRRVYDMLASLGVELLVIDEIQHLAVSKHRLSEETDLRSIQRSRTSEVTDTLKAMPIRGVVPMRSVRSSRISLAAWVFFSRNAGSSCSVPISCMATSRHASMRHHWDGSGSHARSWQTHAVTQARRTRPPLLGNTSQRQWMSSPYPVASCPKTLLSGAPPRSS